MTDLIELAKRCEAAAGPDRDLDAAICVALRVGSGHEWAVKNYPTWIVGNRGLVHCEKNGPNFYSPTFTASIDSAITLVPTSMRWCIDTCDGKPRSFVEPPHPYEGQPFWGNARTLALTLCAAALRARAS